EAAARAGGPERGGSQLEGFAGWAHAVGSPLAQALVARCRALLAEPSQAEAHFRTALRLHPRQRPIDRAHTELLYGEFLRRERRRLEARPHLRAALASFESLGLEAWAERARVEVRASGERASRRTHAVLDRLT